MKRILIVGTAIAGLFACGAATAQSVTNTPALLSGPAYTPSWGKGSSMRGTSAVPRVGLGGAGHFVILSESGITDVPASPIVGNIGTSPITGAADLVSCAEVTGRVYSVDAAGPAPCNRREPSRLTVAIGDMQTAYTDAAGRPATIIELGGGNIGGLILKGAHVYKWSTDVNILKDVTLKGDSYAIWIFQIAGNLNVANGKSVLLGGNAQAQNVFWQVAGKVTLGTTSHFEGIILSKTLIAMGTGASINGRLLAQTAVTLQKNSVTAP